MSESQPETENGEEPEVETIYPGRGPDRDQMASSYLPEQEEWIAKTHLDLNDPQAAAALSQFHRMFPEVEDAQDVIDGFTREFFKGRTSIGGESRNEYQRIIESMFGGHPDTETKRFAALLGADEEE